MPPLKPVIVETRFRGRTPKEELRNIEYARACAHDCLVNHSEAPFLSHLLYTQPGILDDTIPTERQLGIDAGLAIGALMQATIVYTDLGISTGMQYGIDNAKKAGRPIIYRTLGSQLKTKRYYRTVLLLIAIGLLILAHAPIFIAILKNIF